MSAIEPSPSSMTHAHTVSGRGDDSIKPLPSSQSVRDDDVGPKRRIFGVARWTLGIFLLMVTVVMWTASSFLGSVRGTSLFLFFFSLVLLSLSLALDAKETGH